MTEEDGPPPSPGPSSTRPRAPTITIDTSAVGGGTPPQERGSEALPLRLISQTSSPQGDAGASSKSELPVRSTTTGSHRSQASKSSIPELLPADFSDRESRPTSPHNVSSPTKRDYSHGFLAVPGLRSRQNSIDSSDNISHASHGSAGSSYGGETHVHASSSVGDRDRLSSSGPGDDADIMNDEEALTPDPGTENDFVTSNNKFAYSVGQLNKMLNPKSLSAFYALGGIDGLEKGLRTDRKSGLSSEETTLDGNVTFDSVRSTSAKKSTSKVTQNAETPKKQLTRSSTKSQKQDDGRFVDRKRIFKDNRLPVKEGKSLLQLMWITYNDKVLILLSAAALVSLAVGLYQTFGTHHDAEHPLIEWVEGVAIVIAIVVVVVVGSLNDYQKERQFVKLNKVKQDRSVNVIRSGKSQEMSVFDILVGDVVLLEPGDMVPVDGIFIEGHNIKCDESQTTGESDLIRKKPAAEVFAAIENGENLKKMDPFILSGAQITEGVGSFLVTSTGVNSSHGKILVSLRDDPEVTPLQSKLNTLAEYIAKLGGAAGLILFVVLFIQFLRRLPNNTANSTEKGQEFLQIFIVTVTIIVVAVPEGLPLAVTLALAFATTRMLKDHNLVRHLRACEVMGNATAICSDKTGTLTQNKMLVVAGTVGTSSRFGGTTVPSDDDERSSNSQNRVTAPRVVDNIPLQEVVNALSTDVKDLLKSSIVMNSTAFEGEVDGKPSFVGSKTETALLTFAQDFLAMGPLSEERANQITTQLIPFDSKRKCMGIVIKTEKKYRLYVKGASEIVLEQCTQVIRDPTRDTSSTNMSRDSNTTLNNLITSYAERSLRTIGLAYRDFEAWPPRNARRSEGDPNEAVFEDVFKNMVLLGIVGIQDPLREGVRDAVQTCQKAGVTVRMVTGDNITTAKAIAADCGIFTAGGVAMEGPAFRKLTKSQMEQVIPYLQVLARSSPEDKRILVKRLKDLGETVAVTGDGTNDAPALKTADVGFSMGITGTEVAKEASAIILMDDNFASIVKAMMWGRAVNDAVKKFLQFQVTVNITAVLLTFITAVASSSESSILTAVQLLWVNLIMDTMAALALATDPPTPSILDRKPDPKSAPLITTTMWKMIIGESIYQLVITMIINFGGANILNYDDVEDNAIPTLVFNTFVWMQIFNQWNNRRLDNKFNIFEGMMRNYFFIAVNIVMIGGQVLIIFIGGKAFNVQRLTGPQWGCSIVLGVLSIPIGAAIRLIPDELLGKLIPESLKRRSKAPQVLVEDEEQQFQFPQPLSDVKEELSFLKKVKGGRLNNLKFAMQHPRETLLSRSRSGSRSRSNSLPHTPVEFNRESSFGSMGQGAPPTPESRKRGRSGRSRSNSALGATAVMAGIIAGSVAGWSPVERSHGDNDSMRFSRSPGRADLESRDGVEIHPSTKPDDPVIVEEPANYDAPPSQVDEIGPSQFGGPLHPPKHASGHT